MDRLFDMGAPAPRAASPLDRAVTEVVGAARWLGHVTETVVFPEGFAMVVCDCDGSVAVDANTHFDDRLLAEPCPHESRRNVR